MKRFLETRSRPDCDKLAGPRRAARSSQPLRRRPLPAPPHAVLIDDSVGAGFNRKGDCPAIIPPARSRVHHSRSAEEMEPRRGSEVWPPARAHLTGRTKQGIFNSADDDAKPRKARNLSHITGLRQRSHKKRYLLGGSRVVILSRRRVLLTEIGAASPELTTTTGNR